MAGKTLYHSELVGMGDVDAMITDGPRPSKYDGKPPIVMMRIDGTERIYNVENDGCGQALTGLKGQTVTLRAEGSRDDATITVFDAPSGHHQPNPQPRHQEPARSQMPQRPPPREQAPPQEQRQPARNPAAAEQPKRTKEQREADELAHFKRASRLAKQCGVLMELSLDEAVRATDGRLTNDDLRQVAITIFIELKSRITPDGLPISRPVLAAPAAQPQPARQPAPPAEPPARHREPPPP